jgi:hypothetical protein
MSFFLQPLNGMIVLIRLVAIVVTLTALLDVCVHRGSAFVTAGKQTKSFWIVVMVLGMFFTLGGMIAAIVYFVDIRPEIGPAGRDHL